jgi:hypothetical protein
MHAIRKPAQGRRRNGIYMNDMKERAAKGTQNKREPPTHESNACKPAWRLAIGRQPSQHCHYIEHQTQDELP